MTREPARLDPGLYARSFVDVYDEWYEHLHDVDEIARAVTQRVGPRTTVVELGSGSGRIAGPLTRQHTVIALDSSVAMLQLDPSASLPIGGDMADLPLADDAVDAAIVAYNTFFNLATDDQQRRSLDEIRRVLRPGGWVVIEAFIAPTADPATPFGISIVPHHTRPEARMAIATWNDPDDPNLITGAHIELGPDGTRSRPWCLAYHSPAAIDDAAAGCGLELVERHADWAGTEFDPAGVRHVSWYRSA